MTVYGAHKCLHNSYLWGVAQVDVVVSMQE